MAVILNTLGWKLVRAADRKVSAITRTSHSDTH
jgi:hypothetical protein